MHPIFKYLFTAFCSIIVFTYQSKAQAHLDDLSLHSFSADDAEWISNIKGWATHQPSAAQPAYRMFYVRVTGRYMTDHNGRIDIDFSYQLVSPQGEVTTYNLNDNSILAQTAAATYLEGVWSTGKEGHYTYDKDIPSVTDTRRYFIKPYQWNENAYATVDIPCRMLFGNDFYDKVSEGYHLIITARARHEHYSNEVASTSITLKSLEISLTSDYKKYHDYRDLQIDVKPSGGEKISLLYANKGADLITDKTPTSLETPSGLLRSG